MTEEIQEILDSMAYSMSYRQIQFLFELKSLLDTYGVSIVETNGGYGYRLTDEDDIQVDIDDDLTALLAAAEIWMKNAIDERRNTGG